MNTILPGPVNNEMMRRIEKSISPNSPLDVQKGFQSTVPLDRYAESKEIAEMALFLGSDQSSYITGCTLVVDGGMMIA
ncbi:SDR family oxidoreductase [Arenibacter amylolyticus]|uniref:SDR family oxidoreductase n=1 Tax=Arenibacter amylolyticus TaxID=1406873 RepID=UPI001FE4931D|nr:SDR family oxidoreductase [Arenibacter amylolyticus]